MNRLLRDGLSRSRRAYIRAFGSVNEEERYGDVTVTDQAASDLIRARLAAAEPAMIARLGGGELLAVLNYLGVRRDRSLLMRSAAYVRGASGPPWWDEEVLTRLGKGPGFFPPEPGSAARFAELMLAEMGSVDVLGSFWQWRERYVAAYLGDAVRVKLRDLEPYYHERPWSEVLAGKRVLVVHPFAQTIESQYERRSLLFADPRVLPEFQLITYPAVQSIAGTATRFETWFDALAFMQDEIARLDFDVALIGAGAYGFPLAAHVKRLGRKAVHLGGATQVLFGIKGKRWDEHPVIAKLYNEYWVRPQESERPASYLDVEAGAYW